MKKIGMAIGDLTAVLLFVPLGVASHNSAITLGVIGRNLIPIVTCWIAVSIALRTYTRFEASLSRTLLTWVIAVPLALLIRAALLGRLFSPVTAVFIAVAMTATGVLLLAWRGIAWGAGRIIAPRTEQEVVAQ